MSEIDPPREKVSLFELAWTFNHIALASFGGGLSAWSREVLVVDLTAICTAIFTFSKTNPLIVVAAAGVLGYSASSDTAGNSLCRRRMFECAQL